MNTAQPEYRPKALPTYDPAEAIALCLNCTHVSCRYGTCEEYRRVRRECVRKRANKKAFSRAKKHPFQGGFMSAEEFGDYVGICASNVRSKLRGGMTLDEIYLELNDGRKRKT